MRAAMKTMAFALVLLAGACASSPYAGKERHDWSCEGGKAFSVRFDGQGSAEVFAGGQIYQLPQTAAASGTRYSNGAVDYQEHQGEAGLTGAFGGPYANCRQG